MGGRAAREKFFELSADPLCVARADGVLLEVNAAWTAAMGWRSDELRVGAVSLTSLVHPEDREEMTRALEQLTLGASSIRLRSRWRVSGGGYRWIEWSCSFDPQERLLYGCARDVTDQRRVEQDMEKLYRLSIDMLCVANEDGYFERVNPAFEATLGWPEAELLAKPFVEFVHPEDRNATRVETARLASGQQTLNFENRYKTARGDWCWMQWRSTQDPETGRFFAMARDVTMAKKTAAALRDAMHAAEEASAQANAANREKTAFLASMSHELRTPLNAIIGYAEMIAESEPLSARGRESLEIVHSSGHHLLMLISDLLDISKIESGKLTIRDEPFDLHRMLRMIGSVFERHAREQRLAFRYEEKTLLPSQVTGDETRLRQVLINLLSNAIKYTARGSVALRVAYLNGALRFEVEDTGDGIPDDMIEKIFLPFEQLEKHAGSAVEGTGLGLAISRHIVRKLGGDIHVESELGRGSVFWFQYPVELVGEHDVASSPTLPRVTVVAPEKPELTPPAGLRVQLTDEIKRAIYEAALIGDIREIRGLLDEVGVDHRTAKLLDPSSLEATLYGHVSRYRSREIRELLADSVGVDGEAAASVEESAE